MAKATMIAADGKKTEMDLTDGIFGVQVNVPVMHEVVRAELAAGRAGTHSTKTRAEVRGGGAKPWRQKGTGRARHGSIREPQWVGGGVAHGPKPKDHSIRINKKVRALALRSALTDRVREGKLLVIEPPAFDTPETKKAVELLGKWEASGRVLLVLGRKEAQERMTLVKSFRNLPEVLTVTYPTTYTVLAADTVVMTTTALDELVGTPKESDAAAKVEAPVAAKAEAPAAADVEAPDEGGDA